MKPVSLNPAFVGPWLPRRPAGAHKGDVGHVLVAAGSRGLMGAARLCALGALRGGAGLVTLAVPESQYAVAAAGPWEVMVLPLAEEDGAFHPSAARRVLDFIDDRGVTSLALGPGLSRSSGAGRFALTLLEKAPVPVVADADALNALAGRPVLAGAARLPRRKAPWIVTPHPGEAARLLKASPSAVQKGRAAAVQALAERFGATAVLKGAGTLVSDGKNSYGNATGHPGMASGGMGDVLTGLIAALIGQVEAPSLHAVCLRAAALGVFLHGRAGEKAARDLGPVGIAASDLAGRLPSAFKDLF